MARKQEPKWNNEELADAEIYSAIRYLDKELPEDSHSDNPLSRAETALFTICVLLIIMLLGYLGYFWLYRAQ